MFKSSRFIITMIVAVVILAGIIFILYSSYTNTSSHVTEFLVRDGMVVTDENGEAVKMTFLDKNLVPILISTVVLIGGGLLLGIKLAKKNSD